MALGREDDSMEGGLCFKKEASFIFKYLKKVGIVILPSEDCCKDLTRACISRD